MTSNSRTEAGIDLWEWAESVIRYKWIVVTVVFLFVILACLISYLEPNVFVVTNRIEPLLGSEITEVTHLREAGLITYDERLLFEKFNRNLIETDLLIRGIDKFKIVDQKALSEDGYKNALVNMAKSIKVNIQRTADDPDNIYSELIITNDKKDSLLDLSFWLMEEANNSLATYLLQQASKNLALGDDKNDLAIAILEQNITGLINLHRINTDDDLASTNLQISEVKFQHDKVISDQIKRKEKEIELLIEKNTLLLEDQIEEAKLEIEQAKKEYEATKQDRIFFLEAHNEIADELNIDYIYDVSRFTEANSVVASVQSVEQPYFYRGRLAIEKEIQQIGARDPISDEAFVPNLRSLERRLFTLQEKLGKKEYVNGLRALELDLAFLNNEKQDEVYISGLRDLQLQAQGLESRKGDNYVEGLRELEVTASKKRDSLSLRNQSQMISDSTVLHGQVRLASFDTLRSNIEDQKRSLFLTIIVGFMAGGLIGSTTAILLGSFTSRRKAVG